MTPHREWLYEYEKCNGGNVFLRDESMDRIIGCGRVKDATQGWKYQNYPWCFAHFRASQKIDIHQEEGDVCIQTMFAKETCKMV